MKQTIVVRSKKGFNHNYDVLSQEIYATWHFKMANSQIYNSLLKPLRMVKCVSIILYKSASDKLNWNTLTNKKPQTVSLFTKSVNFI